MKKALFVALALVSLSIFCNEKEKKEMSNSNKFHVSKRKNERDGRPPKMGSLYSHVPSKGRQKIRPSLGRSWQGEKLLSMAVMGRLGLKTLMGRILAPHEI